MELSPQSYLLTARVSLNGEYANPMNAQQWCHNPLGAPQQGLKWEHSHVQSWAVATPWVVSGTSVFSLMNTVWDDEALGRHQGPLPVGAQRHK